MPKPIAALGNVTSAFLNDLVGVYDRETSEVDIVNTAVGSALYSKSIGAGHMSTDRMLRCTIQGDYLNNSGVSQTLTLTVSLGATAAWQDLTTVAIPTDADRRPFRIVVEIANRASASVQNMTGTFWLGAAVAGSGAGIGDIDAANNVIVFGGTAAEDTSVAKSLTISAAHGVANANLSIRKRYAMLELL